jgi:cytochrome d ubiquinol oxidase subunit II
MEDTLLNLNTLWFVLIAVLWIGYFFLEGFDFGVGVLFPFLGKDDTDRRVMLNTIGPVWDGNEVWLLTAGGATFAAFPEWYGTLFSGFYLPLFLILVALIFRNVAFEFRSKDRRPEWKAWWDRAVFLGSALPALLWGVAFTNIVRGVKIAPVGDYLEYTGGFFDLLNPYAILGGLTSLLVFTLHGAIFLTLKTRGDFEARAQEMAVRLAWPAVIVTMALLVWTWINEVRGEGGEVIPGLLSIVLILAVLALPWLLKEGYFVWSFAVTGAGIALLVAILFMNLYPNVMPSSIDPAFSLDIYNAASTNTTLRVMTVVAAIFTPVVLAYQGWTYWVFRKRIGREDFAPAGTGDAAGG